MEIKIQKQKQLVPKEFGFNEALNAVIYGIAKFNEAWAQI